MGLFANERGYTSIAVAVALLVSVSLVFCVASVEWTLSRGADVQEVADATAMAGSNVVAAYCVIAQTLDACVLSLGLAGMTVLGSGLVLAAVPGAQGASASALETAEEILDMRRSFAQSVAEGLNRIEGALPTLCMANGASCAAANGHDEISYVGVAVPFPQDSHSDFGLIETDVSTEGVDDASRRLAEATKNAEKAKREADEAQRRGWTADCVDDPSCLRSRAASLVGMAGADNPAYDLESWGYGKAIRRARTYYARRIERERPTAQDIESVTDSKARAAWYGYALDEVNAAWYHEAVDGSVSLHVPHLARNADEVRRTALYTDAIWPCTDEPEGRTLHSTFDCPGAKGASSGKASVADIDSGAVKMCAECAMDVTDLGAVASISTSAKNGFEHYWQQIVEAAADYEAARNQQVEDERAMRSIAEEGSHAFQEALEQLRVPRPTLCPPGAWGCVSVVRRSAGAAVPDELTRAFLSSSELPAGVAVSAATLARDESTDGSDVLSRFFDGISASGNPLGGMLDGFMGLWGGMLVSYGAAFEGTGSVADAYLGKLDGVLGAGVGGWLKHAVAEAVGGLGLQPADMRLRKPVLANTSYVLGKAGIDADKSVRELVQALPGGGTYREIVQSWGMPFDDRALGGRMVVAELPLPGGGSIPLSVDLSRLGAAA